jgi:hypothetical protein
MCQMIGSRSELRLLALRCRARTLAAAPDFATVGRLPRSSPKNRAALLCGPQSGLGALRDHASLMPRDCGQDVNGQMCSSLRHVRRASPLWNGDGHFIGRTTLCSLAIDTCHIVCVGRTGKYGRIHIARFTIFRCIQEVERSTAASCTINGVSRNWNGRVCGRSPA